MPIHPIPVMTRHPPVRSPARGAWCGGAGGAGGGGGAGGAGDALASADGGGSVSTAEDSTRRIIKRIGGYSPSVSGTGERAQERPDRVPAFEKLSIFYPMWNEEAYIERALGFGRRACEVLIDDGEIGDYELIVVNDASTDRTGIIADRLAAADHRIRVVHHPKNRKLGGAMKTGFASAKGDLVLYTDADLPFDMSELSRAVRLMREYDVDIVSAYRFDRTGEGSLRAAYSFVYNALIKALFGVRVRDINFAFKLCKRRIFDHIELHSEGSFVDAELVIRATRLGFETIQFGVDYFPRTRGESTLSSPAVIGTIVREMLQLRKELEGIEKLPSKS